ncbi:MAG: pre-peptidase C-terminal domain-containing protein [Chloroflexota bacterium]
MSSEPLQVAYRLIREGNKQEAIRVLTPIVRADPQNADAWWLLANAVDSEEQKRRALERVLRLRPEDERAQRMYAQLQGAAPRRAAPPPVQTTVTRSRVDDEFAIDDEFSIDDSVDPFSSAPVERVRVRKQRGRSPCGVILAILGLLVVLCCGLCLVVVFAAPTLFGGFLGDVMKTVTYMPEYPTLESILTQLPGFPSIMETAAASSATSIGSNFGNNFNASTPAPQTLPTDTNKRGTIQTGQTVTGTVDTFVDDSWTFSGDAGAQVVIALNATDTTLDPQLELYDPNGVLVAENDDANGSTNRNSRIEITLPAGGRYTIVVSAFATGGNYELALS